MTGASVIQNYTPTSVVLLPGVYYLGFSHSETTATIASYALTNPCQSAMGVLMQAVGSTTLPTTFTAVAATGTFHPIIGITQRANA
jgi:hypothetical protein